MPPVGFEPTISAGKRPQTYALDRAATGTEIVYVCILHFNYFMDWRMLIINQNM